MPLFCRLYGKGNLILTTAFAAFTERRRRHMAYYRMASKWMTPLYQSHYPVGFFTTLVPLLDVAWDRFTVNICIPCAVKQGLFDWKSEQDAL